MGQTKKQCACLWEIVSNRIPAGDHDLLAQMLELYPDPKASQKERLDAEYRRVHFMHKNGGPFRFAQMGAALIESASCP